MITISLCMIVKNEEQVLGRCLKAAGSFADEIIIVDTGSCDRTKEIGREYGGKVYDFAWRDDFAAARNEAFSKANMDYCMWLDADDVVTEENQEKIKKLKQELEPDTDVVMMKYSIAEDSDGKSLFSYYRERLVKNGRGFYWEGRVHEAIAPWGKIIYSDIVISHKKEGVGSGDRNLKIYEKMIEEGESLSGRSLFYYGRELLSHNRYEEAVQVMEEFLEGDGWRENKIEACLNLAECFRMLGKEKESVQALFKSFLFDTPRGEACFELGRYFQGKEKWEQAVFWYETALRQQPSDKGGGFIRWDYYGYLPEINLCVCYDRMGNREKAYEYHQKSSARKPKAKEVQWNEQYFRKMGYGKTDRMDEPNYGKYI